VKIIDTGSYCNFVYKPRQNRLGVFYIGGGIFYNLTSQKFEFSKDPYGGSKHYEIDTIEITDDFSQVNFSTKIGKKQTNFSITKSYESNTVLHEFIKYIKLYGFSKSEDDVDNIDFLFNGNNIHYISIDKCKNGKLIDALSIGNDSWLLNRLGDIKNGSGIKLEMENNIIICHTEHDVFTYKVDSQVCIINTIQKLINLYPCNRAG
jgi:hypothetical protein